MLTPENVYLKRDYQNNSLQILDNTMFFGYFIGKFPLVFLIGTFVLLAPLLSFFLIYPVSIETDVRRGFSHRNGRSTQEFKV